MNPFAPFEDAGTLQRIATNLFLGWGYDFYKTENRIRADDVMVRAEAGRLLGLARGAVEAAEADFRRERIPAPTRARPFPDPESLAGARRLERLSAAIGAVAGQIQGQPVPPTDLMTRWHRDEATTLRALIDYDMMLVGRAETLRALLEGKSFDWMLDNAAAIETAITTLAADLRGRQALLAP